MNTIRTNAIRRSRINSEWYNKTAKVQPIKEADNQELEDSTKKMKKDENKLNKAESDPSK